MPESAFAGVPEHTQVDILWVLMCSALVFFMQAGFCCLESGLCRAKNSINVSIKNLLDFCVAGVAFWWVGFTLMFGTTWDGFWGYSTASMHGVSPLWLSTFLLYQLMFCGTSTTIVSGAVAERTRFTAYLMMSLIISGLIYPIFGHWAWGGGLEGTPSGWLAKMGFIDFAGSTVVHSVGGWFALAAVMMIGPRIGRFEKGAPEIQGHNIPLAALGAMILWFGWFGFNGGSLLAVNDKLPPILINTNLAAAAGGVAAVLLSIWREGRPNVGSCINGVLGGLVGITASCHIVSGAAALQIGVFSALIVEFGTVLLQKLKIDDAVGAIPVHGFCGVWGTLAVAIFAPSTSFGNGNSQWGQLAVQTIGVGSCFLWSFGIGGSLLLLLRGVCPLRVNQQDEQQGLNVSEHGASTALLNLLEDMSHHRKDGDFSGQVRCEPHTEVGQIAEEYNRVIARVNAEIAAREMAVADTQAAEEKYRAIFENAIEGIFQTSLDGKYLSANRALARIYGYTDAEDLISGLTNIQDQLYIDPQRRDQFREIMEKWGMVKNFESEVRRRDGSIIWISESARLVRFPDGRPSHYEGSVEDISERITARKLQREKQAAEAANQAKTTFLAKMSHEIRTPLNGVIGMLELLSGTQLDPRQQRYARIARQSADALLVQINDILDISKIEAGKLELENISFDLRMIMEDVAEMFAMRAEEKKIELSCHLPSDLPVSLSGDPERIRQMIINLVNNALKFTEKGEVTIRAALLSRTADDRGCIVRLRLSVQDTGIGMTPEQQQRLFSAFSQVDASVSRRFGGTGLGLSICKQLCELMGGKIGVESTAGRGSTFWVEVPFQLLDTKPASAKKMPQHMNSLRVLVVDDTPTNLEILHDQLLSWGFEFTPAVDGKSALEELRKSVETKKPFQFVILDQQLPGGMDGLDIAAAIRDDENLRHLPLLMLTSVDCDLDPAAVKKAGLNGLLTKPIRQSRLYDTIVEILNDHLNGGRKTVSLQGSRTDTPAKPSGDPGDPSAVMILVVDDNEINRMVTGEIVAGAGYVFETATNGREAVEKLKASPFDVALMDCQMPEMDGFEATGELRRWEGTEEWTALGRSKLHIIALTANAVRGDRERCLEAGMDDYVTKPIDPKLLLNAIQKRGNAVPVHPNRRASDRVDQSARKSTTRGDVSSTEIPSDIELQIIDVESLLQRCCNDSNFATRVLRKFQARVPQDVEEIRQACTGRDPVALKKAAHTLKGAAGNLSAQRLHQKSSELEQLAVQNRLDQADSQISQLETEIQQALEQIEQLIQRWDIEPNS
ncbi:MAG: ammonium transporter [Planctomycetales bacterium]